MLLPPSFVTEKSFWTSEHQNRTSEQNIRTGIIHLKLDEEFYFNESDAMDLLQTPDQDPIPVIYWRRKQRF
jgi:hypothetical protein